MGDNTWTSERNNEIHIKKSKVGEAVEKEITLRSDVIQRVTKSRIITFLYKKVALL